MEQFYVEGLFVTKKGLQKAKKSGRISQADIELFARSFWANNPAEAIQLATEALEGGKWKDEPKISRLSEDQRMRQLGMPELPGFGGVNQKGKGKPKKPKVY